MSKIENNLPSQYFHLPIFYTPNKTTITETIVDDLELRECKDNSSNSLYKITLHPTNIYGQEIVNKWSEYYTTDVHFLKDSRSLYKLFEYKESDFEEFNDIYDLYQNMKNTAGFHEKYHFINWNLFERLNYSSYFLSLMSLYNITSPLFSLLIPFIMLLIPFFLLKMQKLPISFTTYIDILKKVMKNHSIGKLVSEFKHVEWDKRIYLVVSVLFYCFQVYQNILTCIRFYINMSVIHKQLFSYRKYVVYTMESIDNFLHYSNNLTTYKSFNAELSHHKTILMELYTELKSISPYKFNITKCTEIGHVMKCFYKIYNYQTYHESILYSFGFHGYTNTIHGLQENIKNKHMNFCVFSDKTTKFKNAYYPPLIHDNPIKNTYNLKNPLIITGPNAAGKTTLLKTTIFNIILSQQIGCGFYNKATIMPYHYIHCYLNIPDTSGRDSLFQAEARRCKEIIDCIASSNTHDKHFCIFDELYSGTNPYEAIGSAYAFLTYLMEYKNVHFILTTHFIDLCLRLDKTLKNYHMSVGEHFNYTYKLRKGISSIKGGVKVLHDLNYPEEIIKSTEQIVQSVSNTFN